MTSGGLRCEGCLIISAVADLKAQQAYLSIRMDEARTCEGEPIISAEYTKSDLPNPCDRVQALCTFRISFYVHNIRKLDGWTFLPSSSRVSVIYHQLFALGLTSSAQVLCRHLTIVLAQTFV